MIKQLGVFLAGAAAVWAITFAVGCVLWSDRAGSLLACSLAGLLLCLIPTTLTFLWSVWGLKQTPDQQLAAVLGSTGLRLFFVLGLGLLLGTTVSYLREHQLTFWLFVLFYYLTTLALEMVLLVRLQTQRQQASKTGASSSVPQ